MRARTAIEALAALASPDPTERARGMRLAIEVLGELAGLAASAPPKGASRA